MSVLKIHSHGIDFKVRMVNEGEKYGLNDKLVHDKKDPLVEFYDTRYPHTEHGQFVSRYYLSTLLDRQENVGLNLDGGVLDWYIDSQAMNKVIDWLKPPQKTLSPKKKM